MASEIEARIGKALDNRRTQSAFVDQLRSTWQDLIGELDSLTGVMEALHRANEQAARPVPGLASLLGEWLEPAPDGPPRLAELRRRAQEVSGQIDAVAARMGRATVNLGVVGVTRSGKSTMLRAICGLDDRVVPSSKYNPTTAAPSRIYHRPQGFKATLDLHDWGSFRDSYLARLHHSAKLGPPPATIEEFAQKRYDEISVETTEEPFLRKLQIAQRTLPSYVEDLRRAGTREVAIEELRHYVAYPDNVGTDPFQPYHGVRSVAIQCPFPQRDTVKLGLVDLPGEGEVGLEVDELFLNRMRTEVDLLLLLKRPADMTSFFTSQDESALRSVAVARGGVELHDAVFLVVNTDLVADRPGLLQNALAEIDDRVRTAGIRKVACDAASPADVETRVVIPVLEHLAERLVEMDRAGVKDVIEAAQSLARDAAALGAKLSAAGGALRSELPDEERRLLILSRDLRDHAGRQIKDLRDEYDRRVDVGEPDPELGAAIENATQLARAEIAGGFGIGRDVWITQMHNALGVHAAGARERAHNDARGRIAAIYDEVDGSLRRSVQKLWSDLATVLNVDLGDTLVPDPGHGEESLRALSIASKEKAGLLKKAVDDVLELEVEYGSLVLRVTRPILRGISENPPPLPRSTPGVGRVAAGIAADGVAGAVGIPIAVSPLIEASASWWEKRPTAAASAAPSGGGGAEAAEGEGATSRTPISTTPSTDAQGVFDAVCAAVSSSIDRLDAALLEEARDMPKCLAAALDRFWDDAFVADMSEYEIKALCDPVRASVWPGKFDGAEAQLATSLAEIVERASRVQRRASQVAALEGAVRLR